MCCFAAKPVKDIIANDLFWFTLEALVKLMTPFTKVVTAIQTRQALLADVLRYFLYLGKEISNLQYLPHLPRGLAQHCISAFNFRYVDIITPICHLALFLHPQYRHSAVRIWRNGIEKPALEMLRDRKLFTKGNADALMIQLQAYKERHEPFDATWVDGMSLLAWWKALLAFPSSRVLATIAIVLASIVPHSADLERLFSIMGWFHSPRRSSMLSDKLGMMSKVRTYYSSDVK